MGYDSGHLARLVQDTHTGEVIRLEDHISRDILGHSDSVFADLIRRTLAAWTRAFGGPSQPGVPGDVLRRIIAAARAAAGRILDQLAARAPHALLAGVDPALAMGVRQGAAFVHAASGRSMRVPAVPRASRVLLDEARRIRDMVAERRRRAEFLLHPERVTRWSQLLAGLGAARATLPAIRAHVAWVVNTAVHEGLDAVVRATAPLRLWVSEADACVRCLAYTGRTVATDEPFAGGLSWDPRQRHLGAPAVDGPPLHAHCRCRAVPWDPDWTTEGTPFPDALQREAQRSIAYGTAGSSESRPARLRAVRELLNTVDDLLPVVQARAWTAVQTGRFPAAA